MKSTLTKTLMCGLIASSFILVNCQKASNRKLKGTPSNQTQQQNGNKTVDPETTAQCTPEFTAEYTKWDTLKKEVTEMIAASENADAAQKEKLKTSLKKMEELTQSTVAVIEKMKLPVPKNAEAAAAVDKKATACSVKDKSGKAVVYTIESLKDSLVKMAGQIDKLVGEESEISKKARENKEKEDKATKNSSDIEAKPFYNVSKEMNRFLADKNTPQTPNFIMDGKIQDERFEEVKLDSSKSLCFVTQNSTMLDDDKLRVDTLGVTKLANEGDKQAYEIQLGEGDSFYNVKCLIPKGASINTEFKKIVGSHLLTDVQVEEAKKAAAKPEATADAQAKVDQEKAAQDKAAQQDSKTQQGEKVEQTPAAQQGEKTQQGEKVQQGQVTQQGSETAAKEEDKVKKAKEKVNEAKKALAEAEKKVTAAENNVKSAKEKIDKLQKAVDAAGDKEEKAQEEVNKAANDETKKKAQEAYEAAREAFGNAVEAIQEAINENSKKEKELAAAKEEVAKKSKELADAEKELIQVETAKAAGAAAEPAPQAQTNSNLVMHNLKKEVDRRATK